MDIFAALSDPVRKLIVDMLSAGERPAGEISAEAKACFDISPSAVSQHLNVLMKTSLVLMRRDGKKRIYRLDPKRFADIQPWLSKPQLPRKQPMPPVTFVDATDLETWAGRLDSQSILPQLIRRLILATGKQITRIEFRAGEGVQ